MDGFDDLLAPSRHGLEDNPFADPFAKRSNSPDPWASPFASSQHSESTQDHTSLPTDSFTSAEDPYHYETSNVAGGSIPTSTSTTGPLSPAADEFDDTNEPLGRSISPRLPGFRESTFSEIATIKPVEAEDHYASPQTSFNSYRASTPTRETESAQTSPPASPKRHSKQSSGNGSIASPSPSVSLSEVVSPLEQPSPIGNERSMPGLSFGSDALGGWQGDQTSWGSTQKIPQPSAEDDSDDDKPIRQTMKHAEYREIKPKPSEPPAPLRNDNGIQPIFVITVDDPQKVGDPIRSFTMYTVHTRTTSPLYQKSAFSVLRRYSDFLWLYETLSINNPGVVVPPVPEKSPFGRFDDHFVRQRRFALEKCIQKIANHPILSKDTDLKVFLESDTFSLDIKHRKAEIAHERGGLMASIGQTIAGPRFYETDEWFDSKKVYLDSLESQLRGLVKAIELVAKSRSDLAVVTGEFAATLGDLSSSDVGKQLSHSLASLGDVERKAQDLQSIQSEQDMVTLMGTVDEYARLINSVRLAFNSRIRMYHAWRAADAELLRTKQSHEKQRAQGRIPTERLGYSLSQIAEYERRALEAKHDYDHVSRLVKSEVSRFEQERIDDFKDSLHAFLEGMISRQKELIGAWENHQHMLLARVGGSKGLQNVSGSSLSSS